MPTARLHIQIGTVDADGGRLSLALVVEDDGWGHIQIFAVEEKRASRGVLLSLDQPHWDHLVGLVEDMQAQIAELRRTGQLEAL